MAKQFLPPQDYLCQRLSYDAETGTLSWRVRPDDHFSNPQRAAYWNRRWAGKPAGLVNSIGYRIISIDDVPFKAHRIIWKMMTGHDPQTIDHVNRARDDNRWENLRSGTQANNRHNAPKMRPATLFKGCRRRRGKWSAAIGDRHLGTFATGEEAHAAYCAAARELYGDFASFD